jgi:hypothetical protein
MSSVYLSVLKLKNLLPNVVIKFPFNPLVAYDMRDNKPTMLLEDYGTKELKKIVKNNNIIVSYMYWNYEFCDIHNLSEKDKDYLLKDVTEDYYVRDNVALGSMLATIACYNILVHTYSIEDLNTYIQVLDSINLDKSVMVNFLIENNFCLPLNDNYLLLIGRVFKDNVKVLNFVFKNNKCLFAADQVQEILSIIDYGGINFAAEFIFNNRYSDKQKLLYTKALIISYDEIIDQESVKYLNANNYKPCLAYYLFSMKVDGKLTSLFFEVLKLFVDSGGSREIHFYENEELSEFFECRNNQIKEILSA